MTIVTVFGGSGFLGRHIVERLVAHGTEVWTAVRRPQRFRFPEEPAPGRIVAIPADVRDEKSVAKAVAGAAAVVNAVAAYVEKGGVTFAAVHEEGARKVAQHAARHGVETLVHISGIGADPASPSRYIRARGRGELIVREAFPGATILRPSAMFGPRAGIFSPFAAVAQSSPIFPLVGGGHTKLQPVHVRDVALAVERALDEPHARGRTFELGGPEIYTVNECVQLVLRQLGLSRSYVPIPFAVAELLAAVLERLPNPPLTVAMIDLLRRDNVVSPTAPGFVDLGITPISVEEALPNCL
jgi:NADH dehydrogenase